MKLTLTSVIVSSALLVSAAETAIIDFAKVPAKGNIPAGWCWSRQKVFSPVPKAEAVTIDGKKAFKISDIKGQEGCRMESYKQYKCKAGDKVIVTADVMGKGNVVFTVQSLSNKKWTGHVGVKGKAIPAKFGKVSQEFTVIDQKGGKTTAVYCHVGTNKGAEATFRGITLEIKPAR